MPDPYLYEDVPVLKNELGIKNEKTLDRIEAEQSRANMMLLYEQGFQDFSPDGLREIHRTLFADIYEWAGQYRIRGDIFKHLNLLYTKSLKKLLEQNFLGCCEIFKVNNDLLFHGSISLVSLHKKEVPLISHSYRWLYGCVKRFIVRRLFSVVQQNGLSYKICSCSWAAASFSRKKLSVLITCSIRQASASAVLGSTPAAISSSVKKQ